MGAFHQLKTAVERGEITVVHIDAVPRSLSTVLEIACAQLADAQVNEPFNRGRCDLDAAAQDVLDAAREVERTQKTQTSIMVVTKTIASEIHPAFDAWSEISGHMIFAVRHPLVQLASLAERLGNDAFVGRGRDDLDFFGLTSRAGEVDAIVSHANFARAAWREISLHYQQYGQDGHTPPLVIDGHTLASTPEATLRDIAMLIDRPYSHDAASSWSRSARDRFNNVNHFDFDYDEEHISVNAWVRRANFSTGIVANTRGLICPRYWRTHYPLSHDYLTKVALPIYHEMTSSQRIGKSVLPETVSDRCKYHHNEPCAIVPNQSITS